MFSKKWWKDLFGENPYWLENEANMKIEPKGADHSMLSDKMVELGQKSILINTKDWTRKERAYWWMYQRFAIRWAYRLALINQLNRPYREAEKKLIEAVRAECAKFQFPDEDRPELYAALQELDKLRKA